MMINKDVEPVKLAQRTVLVLLREKVRQKLNELAQQGSIKEVK